MYSIIFSVFIQHITQILKGTNCYAWRGKEFELLLRCCFAKFLIAWWFFGKVKTKGKIFQIAVFKKRRFNCCVGDPSIRMFPISAKSCDPMREALIKKVADPKRALLG